MGLDIAGDANWEREVLGAKGPVLVEFVSRACAVCRAIHPVLEGLVTEYGDRARFFRVDVREEEDLVWAYQVLSTPTFIAFRDSEPVGSLAGEVDETELRNLLDDAIAGEGG